MDKNKQEVFDAKNITTYWRDQKVSFSGIFVDPHFPPNDNSIQAKDANNNWIDPEAGPSKFEDLKGVDIEWKRASEIFSKYLIFDDTIAFDDVKQGSLGNCYFLSAIAAMTEFPNLIYQIFRTKEVNTEGYYEVVMFIDGEWQVVILDDYFPVRKGTKELVFARPNGCELWVLLLEKAWAKVNGGYVNIISGWPDHPLAAFTGFASNRLDHKSTEKEELWNALLQSDKNDNIMCASTTNENSISECGLVTNHAYTLIGVKDENLNNERIRLVKIRNPWGYKEWNGKWSDKSEAWTPQTKQLFGYVDADDGTFYMEFENFISLYSSTNVCYVMQDSNIKTFKIKENVNKPNVFNMYLEKDGKVSISAIFKHWRYNRELKNDNHPVSLVIAKYNDKNKTFTEVEGEFSSANENLEYVKDFKKGFYVLWIYCNYEHCRDPKPKKYIVRVVSPINFKIKLETTDPHCELIGNLIYSGVKERFSKDIVDGKQFYKVENSFKRTGIGYRCIINNSATCYQKWVNDASGFENFSLLPPFENCSRESFDLMVPPSGYAVCLAMRTNQWGTYWFNLKSSYYSYACKANENPVKIHPILIENYVSMDLLQDHNNELGYYDYISTGLNQMKQSLQFSTIDSKKIAFDDLMKQYSDKLKHVVDLEPRSDDSELTWVKLQYENGFYVGQVDSLRERNGRGMYSWNGDSYYMGYWTNGVKDRYGRCFDVYMKLVYEGDYSKGSRNGKGVFYFNNGDRYEGEVLKDKRHGSGTYFWKDGSKWVGTFSNGLLNGVGMFTNAKGNSWSVEYKNGQYVN